MVTDYAVTFMLSRLQLQKDIFWHLSCVLQMFFAFKYMFIFIDTLL